VNEDGFADVFADGVSVAGGPYGISLTFQLSDPARAGDPDGMTTVARVRLSAELARALAGVLEQAGIQPKAEPAAKR
jgi:hypothetical protein